MPSSPTPWSLLDGLKGQSIQFRRLGYTNSIFEHRHLPQDFPNSRCWVCQPWVPSCTSLAVQRSHILEVFLLVPRSHSDVFFVGMPVADNIWLPVFTLPTHIEHLASPSLDGAFSAPALPLASTTNSLTTPKITDKCINQHFETFLHVVVVWAHWGFGFFHLCNGNNYMFIMVSSSWFQLGSS